MSVRPSRGPNLETETEVQMSTQEATVRRAGSDPQEFADRLYEVFQEG